MARKHSHKNYQRLDVTKLQDQAQTLLANIRFAGVDSPVKTIVLTSSGPDEGKTTTAYALAMAMAQSGKRTLIMDCDMRRRSMGKLLDVHPAAGLYGVLSGEYQLKSAITTTHTHNLYFLDCEPNISSPSDLLCTRRFEALLRTVRDYFDYVVIDAPPVGMFIDGAVVSALADGVVMIVRQRCAKRAAVAGAIDQLRAANVRILGLVLTFARTSDSDYYYYSHYYSHYYNEEDLKGGRGGRRSSKGSAAESDNVKQMRREFDDITHLDSWAKSVGAQGQLNAGGNDSAAHDASASSSKESRVEQAVLNVKKARQGLASSNLGTQDELSAKSSKKHHGSGGNNGGLEPKAFK